MKITEIQHCHFTGTYISLGRWDRHYKQSTIQFWQPYLYLICFLLFSFADITVRQHTVLRVSLPRNYATTTPTVPHFLLATTVRVWNSCHMTYVLYNYNDFVLYIFHDHKNCKKAKRFFFFFFYPITKYFSQTFLFTFFKF